MFKKYSFIAKVFTIAILLPLLSISAEKIGLFQTLHVSGDEQKLEVGDVNIVPLQVTGPPEERVNLIIKRLWQFAMGEIKTIKLPW